MTDRDLLEAFEWAANESATWRMWSIVLWRSARAAWPVSTKVAMMLSGLAIENLLKAILVAQRSGEDVTSRGRLAKDLLDHNLSRIAVRASVHLTNQDQSLGERLTHFVKWAGRYPTPSVASADQQVDVAPNDRKAVEAFYDRLKAHFRRVQEELEQ